MPLSITKTPDGFAGDVCGVMCAAPLTPPDIAAIEAGMRDYAVLVFRDQPLSDDEQRTFTLNFGKLEKYDTPGDVRKRGDHRLGAGIADFSNLAPDGRIMSAEDRIWLFKLADRLWHSDSSYRPVTAKYSLLSGRIIPSRGGNTEFADMRAAYEALDEDTKAEIDDLVCEHSLIYSRAAIGFTELSHEEKNHFQSVRHRLVREDPKTGRKSLFLSSHAGAIVGWTIPEAQMLLRDLTEQATQRHFVYAHHWRPNDLVVWDNRLTMHRARRFDRNEVRDVRRTTLAGEAEVALQA